MEDYMTIYANRFSPLFTDRWAKLNESAYFDRVILGDCVKTMEKMPDSCIDFVLTDPPYITRYTDRQGRQIQNDDNGNWVLPAFKQIYRVLKDDSLCVSFYGWPHADIFLDAWKRCGFRPVSHLTWVKRSSSRIGYTAGCHESAYLLAKGNPSKPSYPPVDVLQYGYSGNKIHPTEKPVSALKPIIEAYTSPGSLILDPFCGSGSTGLAANFCGRHYLLMEIDPKYFESAKKRLQLDKPSEQ